MSEDAPRSAPTCYRIAVAGKLDVRWAGWFDGFALTVDEGTTTLSGAVADQAQLHGVLDKILDLGLPLLSVEAVEPSRATKRSDPAAG
jgi:hypothetical protein